MYCLNSLGDASRIFSCAFSLFPATSRSLHSYWNCSSFIFIAVAETGRPLLFHLLSDEGTRRTSQPTIVDGPINVRRSLSLSVSVHGAGAESKMKLTEKGYHRLPMYTSGSWLIYIQVTEAISQDRTGLFGGRPSDGRTRVTRSFHFHTHTRVHFRLRFNGTSFLSGCRFDSWESK